MPKRGDKHVHISVRVKRAYKKLRKNGVFKLVVFDGEMWPVAVGNTENDTKEVSFEQIIQGWSPSIPFSPMIQKVESDSPMVDIHLTYAEHLAAEIDHQCKEHDQKTKRTDPIFSYTETYKLTEEQKEARARLRELDNQWAKGIAEKFTQFAFISCKNDEMVKMKAFVDSFVESGMTNVFKDPP
jgi:hypothetical protein